MTVVPHPSSFSETAERILGVAEGLAQTRGFHAFSYADIAAELRITKASLHYHFATKAELGHSLLVRYSQRFGAALATLDDEPDLRRRLYRYVQIYEDVLVRDRMCLCGMFAAEYQTLPAPMQRELRRFFDANEAWLARNLDAGRQSGVLAFAGSSVEAARTLTATLEGAMLLARAYEEPARFAAVAKSFLGWIEEPAAM
jgi:TetR/AcrR family transcriptional regulator, transcriptional repressor for nem operon